MAPRKETETRWDLIGLSALAGVGGMYQARASAAAAGATRRAGITSSIELARQAKRVEAQIPLLRLQAQQQHNQLIADFKDWADMNAAVASYMGRDDRSVQAIKQRTMQETAKNVSRLRTQAVVEEAQIMRESASMTMNAINERLAADAQANIQMKQSRASTLSTGLSLFASML